MKTIRIVIAVTVLVSVIASIIVWLWPKQPEIVPPKVDVVARIKYPTGSLECVDLYYGAVRSANHRQYQVCLSNPLSATEFNKRSVARHAQLKSSGFLWDVAPVKKCEPGIKGRPDKVWATSPWTGREELYSVVRKGQYWQITEER